MGTETQKEDLQEEVLLEQPDGSVVVGPVTKTEDEHVEDERLGGSHEDAADEAAIAAGRTEEEREEIRARRRKERQDRKLRQREREDELRSQLAARDSQLAELQERMAVIERKGNQSELAQLDAAIRQAVNNTQHYKDIVAAAVARQDGPGMAEAMDRMQKSQRRAEELANVRTAYSQQQQAPAALDPGMVNHAQKWMAENTWYDPQGRDADSRVLLAVDTALAQEGFNPRTAAYWDELSTRAAKYLPHRVGSPARAKSGYNGADSSASGRPNGRSVVTGSGRDSSAGSASGSTESGYRLSAERVAALKEAGMWDDPKTRAEMIKTYREHDAKQRSSR